MFETRRVCTSPRMSGSSRSEDQKMIGVNDAQPQSLSTNCELISVEKQQWVVNISTLTIVKLVHQRKGRQLYLFHAVTNALAQCRSSPSPNLKSIQAWTKAAVFLMPREDDIASSNPGWKVVCKLEDTSKQPQ